MKNKETKNINFSITIELLEKITQLANEADRSLSAQIRYMLSQYTREHSND